MISAAEIKARLDIGDHTLRAMTRAGTIPAIVHDRTIRYPRAAFEALMGGYSAERNAAIDRAAEETRDQLRAEATRQLRAVERSLARSERRSEVTRQRLRIARVVVSERDLIRRSATE